MSSVHSTVLFKLTLQIRLWAEWGEYKITCITKYSNITEASSERQMVGTVTSEQHTFSEVGSGGRIILQ